MVYSIDVSNGTDKIQPSGNIHSDYRNLLKKGSRSYFADYRKGVVLYQEIPDGDFALWHSFHEARESTKLTYTNQRPLLTLHVSLRGEYQWQLEKIGIVYMKPGEVNLIYLPCSTSFLQLQPGGFIETCDILLSPFYLNQFRTSYPLLQDIIDKINGDSAAILCRTNIQASANLLYQVEQLIDCPFNRSLRRLYFEARVMDIFLELLDMVFAANNNAIQLTDAERSRVFQIKNLLEQNSQLHFTIRELSRKAMLNENKLKKGFKLLTGKTVFDFHLTVRMSKAKELLDARTLSLDYIAEQTGYEHVSSFIAAFKQFTGFTPAVFRKQFKNI